jgi:hypothetical protein
LIVFNLLYSGLTEPRPDVQPVIAAKSTVVTFPKAQHDINITSMVPSSIVARRPAKKADGGPLNRSAAASTTPGFGLLPRSVSTVAPKAKEEAVPGGAGDGRGRGEKAVGDDSYESFMNSMKELGAI